MTFPHLLEPITIGDLTLRNRVVIPPANGLSQPRLLGA